MTPSKTAPLFATALFAAACNSSATAPAADAGVEVRAIQVDTLVVQPETFEDQIELSGTLEALNDATLSAQSTGTIERLLPLGARVKRGRIVAELDADVLKATVRQAEAQLEAARSAAKLAEENYARQQPLYEDGIISALEFENIQAQLNQTKAQVSNAEAFLAQTKKQLANSRIAAPFEGTVEHHFAEIGEQVANGQPVVRLTDTSKMRVTAGVPERYSADISKDAQVQIRFNAYGLEPRTGRLTFVASTIDPESRTFRVEAELANDDGKLKPEMVARLYVTRATLEDALSVPLVAVLHDETGDSVFVVDRGGDRPTAEYRRVELGPTARERVVIDEGLSAGDEVVVAGQNNLTRGDVVEVARQRKSGARASQK